jgi:hypothetical protein
MSEKMIFCLGEGKYKSSGIGYQQNLMIFNKKVSEEVYDNTLKLIEAKDIKLPIAKWVEYKDLSKDEQTTTAKQMGGLLKELSYENAWKEMWNGFSADDKNFFKTLPNFDWSIFTSITGIEQEKDIVDNKIIELNGKKYKQIED